MLKNQRVLITGVTGFIGRRLFSLLNKEGIEVLGISSKHSGDNIINCSLFDKNLLQETVRNFYPTTIVHLAAIANPVEQNVSSIYRTNVEGTVNLFEAIRLTSSTPRVVVASTAGVYGNQDQRAIPESAIPDPTNHYSCSKLASERVARLYADQLNLRIDILRLFNVIGIGQSENFLVPKLVKIFKNKVNSVELGNINAVRDFIDVEFVTNVIAAIIDRKDDRSSILNVCSGHGYSGEDILDILSHLTDWQPKIIQNDNLIRKNEIWRLVGDPSKLFAVLPYRPKCVKEILSDMLAQA